MATLVEGFGVRSGVGNDRRTVTGSFGDTAYSSSDKWHPSSRILNASGLLGAVYPPGFGEADDDGPPMPIRHGQKPDKRRAHRLRIAQAICEGEVVDSCKKCTELEEGYLKDKRNYFLETEHLRRGITKMLDQLANFMSASAYKAFKESLQLDVRFLTSGAEEEEAGGSSPGGGGRRGSYSGGGHGRTDTRVSSPSAAMKDLSEKVAQLEAELNDAEKEINRLNDELAKAKFMGGVGGGAAGRHGAHVRTAECQSQTDISVPKGASTTPFGPGGMGGPGQAGGGPGGGANGPGGSGVRPGGGGGAPITGGGKFKGSGPGGALTQEDIDRLLAERDREAAGRREAEKRIKELEALLAAAESKTQGLEEEKAAKEKEAEEIQARMFAYEGALRAAGIDPASIVVTAEHRAMAAAAAAAAKGKKMSGLPDKNGAAGTKGFGKFPGGGKGPRGELSPEEQKRLRKLNGEDSSDDEETKRKKAGPQMVDACVGNGPGPGLQEDECKIKAKALRPPEEMNKNKNAFETNLRASPNLGMMATTTSTTDDKSPETPLNKMTTAAKAIARLKSGLGRSPSTPATAPAAPAALAKTPTQPLQRSKSAAGKPSAEPAKPTPGLHSMTFEASGLREVDRGIRKGVAGAKVLKKDPGFGWSSAGFAHKPTPVPQVAPEPYLVDVWDKQPAGHHQPTEPELLKLGAVKPNASRMVSGDFSRSTELPSSVSFSTASSGFERSRSPGMIKAAVTA